jgi:hypothetical protein
MPHKNEPDITHAMAERHEALWLQLTALHKDLTALAGRRGAQPLVPSIRITAESLLSDCAPFTHGDRLPVAAQDVTGLLVQLGQARALLEAFETGHSVWNPALACRCWRVRQGERPVLRLRPQLPPPPKTYKGEDIRDKLGDMIARRWRPPMRTALRPGAQRVRGRPKARWRPLRNSTRSKVIPVCAACTRMGTSIPHGGLQATVVGMGRAHDKASRVGTRLGRLSASDRQAA